MEGLNRLVTEIKMSSNIDPLSANPIKWSNTFKQFADELFECV